MVRFVTIKKFCELTGFSAAAVYKRKANGVWLEGSVWRYAPDSKKILMDLQAYDAWVENGESPTLLGTRSPATSTLTLPALLPPTARPNARRTTKRSPVPPKLER